MKKVFLFVLMMISIFFMSSCSGEGNFKFKNWYDKNTYTEFKVTGNLENISFHKYNLSYDVYRETDFTIKVDKEKYDNGEVELNQIFYNNELVKPTPYRLYSKFTVEDFDNIYYKDNNYFYLKTISIYQEEDKIIANYCLCQICTVLNFSEKGLAFPIPIPYFRDEFYFNSDQNHFQNEEGFKKVLFEKYEGSTSNNNFEYAKKFYSKFTKNIDIDSENMKITIITKKLVMIAGEDYGAFPSEIGTVTTTIDYKNSTVNIVAKTKYNEVVINL